MSRPSDTGLITSIYDGIAVVEYITALPYVDRDRISIYGVSLGGNLVMFLASKIPTLRAVVAGQAHLGGLAPDRVRRHRCGFWEW